MDAISTWYAQSGWQVDRAVLETLAEVERKVDCAAVNAALTAVYRPWLDSLARAFQNAIGPAANAGTYVAGGAPTLSPGEIVAFVDGLRLDVGQALIHRLTSMGLAADVTTDLSALPTVTPTAKPPLVPIPPHQLAPGKELDARRGPEGPSATISVLRKLMTEAGVQVLGHDDLGDPTGKAWTEAGEIDQRGHELGLRLAHNVDDLVERIARRVRELLDGGWQKVTIVTDHGWHLLPGGLSKNEGLSPAVTATVVGSSMSNILSLVATTRRTCVPSRSSSSTSSMTLSAWLVERPRWATLDPGSPAFVRRSTVAPAGSSANSTTRVSPRHRDLAISAPGGCPVAAAVTAIRGTTHSCGLAPPCS